ncbi:MAG TPA: zinc-ribbon domain-containing protein [Myxococcota bacterium]|nr:zinc-ribbon domain-containing protein [Myxococcota bacterium]
MIAACPKCSTRYRVENERLTAEGVRLRCTRCQAVFRVRVPGAVAPLVEPQVEAQPTPMPQPPDRSRLVLIADSDAEEGKVTADSVAGWGLHPLLAHDGVEAILAIQRNLPRAVILDAALPKMFGFQICELMKRNAELREIHVVLIGAIHHRERYRRSPHELYGADAYLERPDLPHGLITVLRDFGLPIAGPSPAAPARSALPARPAAPDFDVEDVPMPLESARDFSEVPFEVLSAPAAAPVAPGATSAAPPMPAVPPRPSRSAPSPGAARAPLAAPAAAPINDGLAEERAKAERLARIIVSDVILYNQEKFARAVATGRVVEMLDPDLEEGRALFRQRIDARVREERDHLAEELVRVARTRGMR